MDALALMDMYINAGSLALAGIPRFACSFAKALSQDSLLDFEVMSTGLGESFTKRTAAEANVQAGRGSLCISLQLARIQPPAELHSHDAGPVRCSDVHVHTLLTHIHPPDCTYSQRCLNSTDLVASKPLIHTAFWC